MNTMNRLIQFLMAPFSLGCETLVENRKATEDLLSTVRGLHVARTTIPLNGGSKEAVASLEQCAIDIKSSFMREKPHVRPEDSK